MLAMVKRKKDTLKEKELIRQCKKGSPKAQKLLYDRYSMGMYRLCLRYVRDEFEAEDIMIKGFVKVFRHISNFEQRNNVSIGAWVKKIMVNDSLAYLRKRNNFNMVASSHAEDIAEVDLSPLAQLSEEDLYALIDRLPDGYRTVFTLYVIEGYDHKAIAEQLHISIGTSKSQLSKAKAVLRDLINKNDLRYGS